MKLHKVEISAEREIRTPVSGGQWISSPPQYQAMRSPLVLRGGPFFQESIFPHSSLLAAIIARPRLAPTVAKVNPGKPESSSGLFAE